jgi:hypothetical protein
MLKILIKTWSPTLKEEHTLRVLGNTDLKKIIKREGNEVSIKCKLLCHEKLYDLNRSYI